MESVIKLKGFKPDEVIVKDPYLVNAYEKELEYLFAFEPDRLLAGFYENAGKTPKAMKYPGWESLQLRGHTIGHYMVAMAQAYGIKNDKSQSEKILNVLRHLISGLKECQFASGYLSAFPEEAYDCIEQGQRWWAPWYTAHKIMSGLIAAYCATGIEDALAVASKYGDWVFLRTSRWTPEIRAVVLNREYGGMNDCMYELYKLTNNKNHLDAAHMFDDAALFEPLHDGRDILCGKHANTTIPKFVGALNRYLALGKSEEFYLETAKNFWDIVVNHHSYIIGANSDSERFWEPDVLDARRSGVTCETCNVYNMLKLTKGLYQVTGDKKYADYYENAFINTIMASQHPETGMSMYFHPMATGFFKVYGTPFDKFWCCQGTGMENFTKLGDSIYYKRSDREIYINGYFSSDLTLLPNDFKLIQRTETPNTGVSEFRFSSPHRQAENFTFYFRIPFWAAGAPVLSVNGMPATCEISDGYIKYSGVFANADELTLTFPITVTSERLAGSSDCYAFRYGPVVLCAALGCEDMEESVTGVICTIATRNFQIKDYITIKNGDVGAWLENLRENLVKEPDTMIFRLRGADEDDNLVFTPYYLEHNERYGIYWYIVSPGSPLHKALSENKQGHADMENAAIGG